MNRKEISLLFTEALKSKLVGTYVDERLDKRKIVDIKVEVSERYWEDECGGSYDEVEIYIKIESTDGKITRWVNYYLL